MVLNHGLVMAPFHAQLGKQRVLEPFYGPLGNALLKRAAAVLVSGDAMATAPEIAGVTEKVLMLPYGACRPGWSNPEPVTGAGMVVRSGFSSSAASSTTRVQMYCSALSYRWATRRSPCR